MKRPHCGKKINAASILGEAGKGKAKTITKADRRGRSERMKALNAKRRSKPANASGQARAARGVDDSTD